MGAIEDAKKPETRDRRVAQTIEKLRAMKGGK
ncbi:MAG: YdeI/OmpD-associated family protein [Solirubrobacteraceae bacterium]